MVRSPHAHAVIAGIATADAAAMPGVLAVLTGKDAIEDGLKPIPHRPIIGPPDIALGERDASDKFLSAHRVLPPDKARFAGEAVAMVVADSLGAARDAAERVRVDLEPRPAVTDTLAAAAADTPRLWDEAASNVCVDAEVGDAAATASAFARAAHVVKLDTWIEHVTGVPLEPRAAVGHYDAASGRITLYAGRATWSGKSTSSPAFSTWRRSACAWSPATSAAISARATPSIPNSRSSPGRRGASAARSMDVQAPGGLSQRLPGARPLRLRRACARRRRAFLALRGSAVSNVGAHAVSFVPLIKAVSVMSSVYRIPAACIRARAVASNTPPTNPYHSAGRPEAMFVIERLIELAAATHGFDRLELRRRDLIGADAMPYANPLGVTYDSGEYARAMATALARADWDGFAQRRAAAARRGKDRGIAIANSSSSPPGRRGNGRR